MKKQKKNTNRKKIIILVVLLVSAIYIIFNIFSISAPILPQPTLKSLAKGRDINLGVHIVVNRLKNKPYREIAVSQFGFATIDGPAQWLYLRPTKNTYNYSGIDTVMKFAKENNMPVQLHHLVWGEVNYLPSWLIDGHFSSSKLLNILHDDISTTASHYKGQVKTWTVVNEAFTRSQHTYGLHDWWADNIGQGSTYIDDSFIWARQADPNAKLLLNDFNNESQNSVSNAEYVYVKEALARGVPIDGIGMQMHIDATNPPSKDSVIANMQRFKALGLPTYITEFDINITKVEGSQTYKDSLQAQITYNMIRACIESKSCISINEFGITDKNNLLKWLFSTNSHSYLFNNRYKPTASFYSFRNALLAE